MLRPAALALVVVSAAAVAAPVPKELKKQATLDGRWEVVEYHSNGRKLNSTTTIQWEIEGEKLTIDRWSQNGAALASSTTVTYSLVRPEGEAPNALDYTYTYTNGNPSRSMPGIFELNGDSLKFCWSSTANGPRPKECTPATGNRMYVFKRAEAK